LKRKADSKTKLIVKSQLLKLSKTASTASPTRGESVLSPELNIEIW